jgi:type I site-specific restriction-modification system R (restriction) subunit
LEKPCYQYVYTPDIAPYSDTFGGVVLTTIQKFQSEEGNVYPKLSDRRNIIVIADEAHRTQYCYGAKTIDTKDDQEIISKQIRTLEKLQDTLLPKLINSEVRIQFGQEATV